MRLEIDYGLAGSGKSHYIKQMLAEKLESGEKLMILVPDQHSFITERSVLEDFGVQNGAKIKVLWFNHLARVITEEYGGVRPTVLDPSGQAILMSKAISEISDKLDYYKKQANKPEFIQSMLNLSAEIKFSKTALKDLIGAGEHAGSPVLQKKLSEIVLICEKYDALVEESYLNPDDVLSRVNALLQEHRFFEGYTVAIDGFGFFDNQKIDIICSIIEQSNATYITLTTDSLELTRVPGDKFAALKKTASRLITAAQEVGADVCCRRFDDLSALKPEFAALSRGIYEPQAPVYEKESRRVCLRACTNTFDECDAAALQIKKLIMQNGYRYKDIAVIVRDEKKFLPMLKRAFKALEIPFFKDSRRSVAHEPLMLFCHYALKACSDGYKTDDVLAYMKSAASGIPTTEMSEFENYCLLWSISGKRKWSKEFAYNPRGFTERFEQEDIEKLKKLNDMRKRVMVPLFAFAKASAGASVKEISIALFRLLEHMQVANNLKQLVLTADNEGEIAEQQSSVWAVLMNCLEQMIATEGEQKISLKEYMHLLDMAVSAANIGVLPSRMDEILVGSADRIRTDLPKAVFLLGVNEGEFPLSFNDGGILNDYERMRLLEQGIELGVNCTSMSAQERFFAYCAALAPSEYLYASYSLSNLEGESLSPSSLIKEIQRVLPLVPVETPSALSASDILSKEQGFGVFAKLYKTDSVLRATLKKVFEEDPLFSSRAAWMEQALQNDEKKIENPKIAITLFGENPEISPTQLEAYAKCPFMYFCKFGLLAVPSQKAALDARTGGTLIHYVLEHIIKHLGKEGIVALTKEQIQEKTDFYINEYLKELKLPEEFMSGRFRYLVYKNRAIIIATLEQMAAEMAQSDFEPTDFELYIQKDENGGYEIALEQGTMRIKGTIDRVDLMRKGQQKYFRIIDYKTGSKEFKLGEVLYGINAQMLLYLFSLDSKKDEKYGDAVASGLLYISASDKLSGLKHGDEQELQKKLSSRFKMSGLVLGEEEVIEGMEHNPSGKFLPIRITKKGIGGNVVSREQLARIRKHLDCLLADMGNALHRGEVDDMPLVTGSSRACDWCDYKAVCRNSESKSKEVEIPGFAEALSAMEGGEENA